MTGIQEGGAKTHRVLVVDDEEGIRSLIKHYLDEREEGFSVETASDGEQALEILSESITDIDAVILDISMPRMGGFETLRHMESRGYDVVTIVLSGRAGEEEQLQAFDLGALDFVKKPFSPEVLTARLKLNLVRESNRETAWPDPWVASTQVSQE